MYIKIKVSHLIIGVVLLGSLLWGGVALAGDPDSPGAPADTISYNLDDLYNRLNAGTVGSQREFIEPSAAPGTGTMHTINEIMTKAPVLDNTNGGTAADVINGKTFWGLTTGEWGLQTGTASPAGVPKTGDTYTDVAVTGEDGELQMGVAWPNPRFTNNGNGTVTDNLTGLMWMQNADAGNDCEGVDTWMETWANALASAAACNDAGGYAGYTDWRLPNVRELHSLVDYGRYNLALPSDPPFISVQSDYYWSGSTYAINPFVAWIVNMGFGDVLYMNKSSSFYVWPVRGGQ